MSCKSDRFHAGGQASWQAELRATSNKATVDCDLGSLSLSGTLRLGEKDGFSLDGLVHQQYEIGGRLDLARLAQTVAGDAPSPSADAGQIGSR